MAIGDYLSNMFLGTAYNQGQQPEGAQKGMQELWKIYQQAYNVKPIWNGKSWVMPPGAVQRFQMLLPLIQAQIQGAYQGQRGTGQGAEGNYGLAGYLTQGLGKSLFTAAGKKLGGWDTVLGKLGDSVKGLWNDASDSINYSDDFSYSPQETADWDTAFSPTVDMNAVDTLPTGQDWDMGDMGDIDYMSGWEDTIDPTADYWDF